MLSGWSPPYWEALPPLHQLFLEEHNKGNLGRPMVPLDLFVVARLHLQHHLVARQHVPFLIFLEWSEPYISFSLTAVVQMPLLAVPKLDVSTLCHVP